MRPSRRSATSSTRECRASKALWSEVAWATRSSRPLGPSTARWSARGRRGRKARDTASASATRATAAAASAAIPAGCVKSSTPRECTNGPSRNGPWGWAAGPGAARPTSTALEDRLVLGLVVVRLGLARDGGDAGGDGHGAAERRRLLEREVRGGAGLGRGLVDRVGQRDRLAAAALDAHGDLDVELVVVAAVGELDRERALRVVGQLVGRAGLERRVAVADRLDVRAVQPGPRRLVAVPAGAGGELLAELLGHDVGLGPVEGRQEARRRRLLTGDLVAVERGADQRAHAGLVGDVGGQEDLHLAGDLLDRLVRGVTRVAERRADALRDVVQAVAAPLERGQQRLLGALHLVGHVEALRLL